ncbi:hypothetical protein SSP24_82210 [Streptomyces spinoverrucosus]|uniref:Uncharacterized protein n=1 Tax=Streptomyces spinoverrucosus TaxID=284043 RepID=A0A4Y3VZU8_9ACTN|nr:hypothetical protein SSP24_82210 [Streptomyces spinoverrucosus]GHB98949.1 hypothetical protein GCM10010397_84080 [Streptomyces spinoverrucosus]
MKVLVQPANGSLEAMETCGTGVRSPGTEEELTNPLRRSGAPTAAAALLAVNLDHAFLAPARRLSARSSAPAAGRPPVPLGQPGCERRAARARLAEVEARVVEATVTHARHKLGRVQRGRGPARER